MHKHLQQFQGRSLASRQTLQFSQQLQEQADHELQTDMSYGFDEPLSVAACTCPFLSVSSHQHSLSSQIFNYSKYLASQSCLESVKEELLSEFSLARKCSTNRA